MPFFKPGSGARHARVARLESATWTLVYGGLLALVLGVFMAKREDGSGTWLMVVGIIAALIGAVLVVVRSRLPEK